MFLKLSTRARAHTHKTHDPSFALSTRPCFFYYHPIPESPAIYLAYGLIMDNKLRCSGFFVVVPTSIFQRDNACHVSFPVLTADENND